jgi:SAM-dependent methyltransferase
MLDRVQKLRQPIGQLAKILEVGPSFNPTTPKSEGWRSFVVDHSAKGGLVEKYKLDPSVDTAKIEEVDYIWQRGYLHEALPRSELGTFDACIASHVIEHIPDLIGFFKSLEEILRPSGVVSLAVPDKRFCFDYFKPITTTGEVLAAYDDKRTRHPKKTAFDFFAYSVRNGSQHAWGQQPPTEFTFLTSLAHAKEAFDGHNESNEAPYIDFHAWHFTPASFELIILELGVLNVIDFYIAQRFATEGCEFFAVLRRGRQHFASEEALQARRRALLKGTLMDAREQIAFLVDKEDGDKSLSEEIIRRLDEQTALIDEQTALIRRLDEQTALIDEQTALIRRLDEQAADLRDIAEVAAWARKMLRPLHACWVLLLPIRRSIARLRGRI